MLELHKIVRASYLFACAIFFFCCFISEIGREECSRLWKINIFSVFNRLGPLPTVFSQLKEWLILELHEIIRVSHFVECQIVFHLFYDRDWQGGMLKLMENVYFLVFLAVWVLFHKFLARFRSGLC